jgi:hypothetical protein
MPLNRSRLQPPHGSSVGMPTDRHFLPISYPSFVYLEIANP